MRLPWILTNELTSGMFRGKASFLPGETSRNGSRTSLHRSGALILRDQTTFLKHRATGGREGGTVAGDCPPSGSENSILSWNKAGFLGKVSVTSHRAQATEIEITRRVLGAADSADHDGRVEKLSLFEDGNHGATLDYPHWWNWYGWPYWWSYFNGIGRITWKLKVEPNQSVDLAYEWHYFWR